MKQRPMQDQIEGQAADARVLALSGRLAWLVVIPGVTATVAFALALVVTAFILTSETGTRALSMDFRVFWAAGRLAFMGEPLAAFDMARLGAVHNVKPDGWMPWLYPPGYLVLLIPFGAMSFSYAFLCATLLSVLLMGLAVRPFVAGSRLAWLAMTLAPAYIPALIIGQNSVLWVAGLLAALAALRDQRWVLAGVIIGCLTVKPQLGLLLPLALLAAGLWRTILAAVVTTVLVALLPTLAFGPEYWPLLVDRLAEQSERLVSSIETLFLMVGPFFFFTQLGASADLALSLQWVVLALVAVVVVLLWRSDRVGFDAKAAGLMVAMLLSSPYLWYYEAAMTAAIGLFLVRAGLLGPSLPQLFLLVCLWLGGSLQAMNTFLDLVDDRLIGALLVTPALTACLVILLVHLAATRRGQPLAA